MNGFEEISKLGEGAYSIVLKVRRKADNNIYALKKVKLLKLSEKEKQNALNEVRILASVKSNFVISYKEAFFEEKESSLGIVMEYADKGEINPFAIDNLQNEERVHAYYKSAENLYQAYQRAGIFKVTLNNVTECVGEDDIERLNQAKLAIEQRKLIVENLANIDKWFANGKISFEEKEKYRTLLRKATSTRATLSSRIRPLPAPASRRMSSTSPAATAM